MKLSELIAAIGDDKVRLQNLDECVDKMDWSIKRGTKITFGTEVALTPEGLVDLGLVVWLPREETAALLAKAKAKTAKSPSPTQGVPPDGRM